jgi:hypothetical protein
MCSATVIPAVPTDVVQKFASYYELENYLCTKDKDSFCQGGNSLVFQDVCKNMGKVEIEVMTGSGIASICQADIVGKICVDQSTTSTSCAGNVINQSFCAKFPDKCLATSTTYDSCAENWKTCINNPHWHFCNSFPEFCDGTVYPTPSVPTTDYKDYSYYKYTTSKDLHTTICAADAAKFCKGRTDMFNIFDVCSNWADIPEEVKTETKLVSACTANLQ